MAVILDSSCIKRPQQRRRVGVVEHFRTQQGEFWREDIKAFFFFFPPLGKGVIRSVSPHGGRGFWLLSLSLQSADLSGKLFCWDSHHSAHSRRITNYSILVKLGRFKKKLNGLHQIISTYSNHHSSDSPSPPVL